MGSRLSFLGEQILNCLLSAHLQALPDGFWRCRGKTPNSLQGAFFAIHGIGLHLQASFFCDDLRNLHYENEFDVVLNMADGAIGYLENDAENLKIFDIIAKALKPGGKSFIDVQSGDYANAHFPQRLWEAGTHGLTLSAFDWNPDTRICLYGQLDYAYGESLTKPEMPYGNPTRLYTQQELEEIFRERGLKVYAAYADINGVPASEKGFQLKVCSEKLPKSR